MYNPSKTEPDRTYSQPFLAGYSPQRVQRPLVDRAWDTPRKRVRDRVGLQLQPDLDDVAWGNHTSGRQPGNSARQNDMVARNLFHWAVRLVVKLGLKLSGVCRCGSYRV